MLGFVGVLSQWERWRVTATQEKLERQRAEHALFRMQTQTAQDHFATHRGAQGLAMLASLLRQNPTNRAVAEWLMAELTFRNWPLPTLEPLVHADEVHYAEFSPDGTRILTTSMDNAARLWDAATGRPLGRALQHNPKPFDREWFPGGFKPLQARFSPDGLYVATASVDNTARVWDGHTGEPVTPPLPHAAWVVSARFSPDGSLIATASNDGTVRLWKASTGQPAGQTLRHSAGVNFVEFSPDGGRLFTGAVDHTAQLWEVETGRPIGQRMQHAHEVRAGCFSPDGKRVVTVSGDRTARIWNAATGEPLSPPLSHNSVVTVAQFSPDGGWLATGALDQTVRLWDGFTGASLGRHLQHSGTVRSVQFSPEGRRLLTAAEDGTARIWDYRTGLLAAEPIRHAAAIWSARFSPDGHKVVTASADRTCGVWDMRPGAAMPGEFPMIGPVSSARWSPDGRQLLVLSRFARLFDVATGMALHDLPGAGGEPSYADFSLDSRQVIVCYAWGERSRVWDGQSGQPVFHLNQDRGIFVAAFSHDGRWILTGSDDGKAALWSADSGQLRLALPHPAMVLRAEFGLGGQRVLTACADGMVRVWDVGSGVLQCSWLAHREEITATHFNPEGSRVATSSRDFTARVWEASSGRPITGPLAHQGEVLSASFSPDGRLVVTASRDSTARLWNAFTGQPEASPFRHNAAVRWANFSPDGKRVVTASDDLTACVWDTATGQPLGSPLVHAGRVFSAEFSPDGKSILTVSGRSAWVWPVPESSSPAPGWLAELAEAVGGLRQKTELLTETVPLREFLQLRRALAGEGASSSSIAWGRWFVAERSSRALSPSGPMTTDQWVAREITDPIPGIALGLRVMGDMLVLCPSNGLLSARAGFVALKIYDEQPDPELLRQADWLSQRAVALAPEQPFAWWAWAASLEKAGALPAAQEAMEQGSRLPGASPQFWLAWGGLLDRAGRDTGALTAYARALEANPPGPALKPEERCAAFLACSQIHARHGRTEAAKAERIRAYGLEIAPRDPQTPSHLIDLSDHYTAGLEGDWRRTRLFGHDLSTLPRGRQLLGGVEYDLRGLVQLSSILLESRGLQYPRKVSGIPVRMKCARLHFLQAADCMGNGASPTEGAVALYTVRWVDGRTEQITIRYGLEAPLWDWEPPSGNPYATTAWHGVSPAGLPVWLFSKTWTNTHPEVVVSNIDLTSAMTHCAPFVVAITAE